MPVTLGEMMLGTVLRPGINADPGAAAPTPGINRGTEGEPESEPEGAAESEESEPDMDLVMLGLLPLGLVRPAASLIAATFVAAEKGLGSSWETPIATTGLLLLPRGRGPAGSFSSNSCSDVARASFSTLICELASASFAACSLRVSSILIELRDKSCSLTKALEIS